MRGWARGEGRGLHGSWIDRCPNGLAEGSLSENPGRVRGATNLSDTTLEAETIDAMLEAETVHAM